MMFPARCDAVDVFIVCELRWLRLDPQPLHSPDPGWSVRGRALMDVNVGNELHFAGRRGVITAIRTYDKDLDFLSAGMTGDLTVRFEDAT